MYPERSYYSTKNANINFSVCQHPHIQKGVLCRLRSEGILSVCFIIFIVCQHSHIAGWSWHSLPHRHNIQAIHVTSTANIRLKREINIPFNVRCRFYHTSLCIYKCLATRDVYCTSYASIYEVRLAEIRNINKTTGKLQSTPDSILFPHEFFTFCTKNMAIKFNDPFLCVISASQLRWICQIRIRPASKREHSCHDGVTVNTHL